MLNPFFKKKLFLFTLMNCCFILFNPTYASADSTAVTPRLLTPSPLGYVVGMTTLTYTVLSGTTVPLTAEFDNARECLPPSLTAISPSITEVEGGGTSGSGYQNIGWFQVEQASSIDWDSAKKIYTAKFNVHTQVAQGSATSKVTVIFTLFCY
jgi:hypothetical protein